MTCEREVYIPSWVTAIIGAALGVAALLYVAHGTSTNPWTWSHDDRVFLLVVAGYSGVVGSCLGDRYLNLSLTATAFILATATTAIAAAVFVGFDGDGWNDTRADRAIVVMCLFFGLAEGSLLAERRRERRSARVLAEEIVHSIATRKAK